MLRINYSAFDRVDSGDDGSLIVSGVARHSGIYKYHNLDGSTRLEFVPPEMFFAKQSGQYVHAAIATTPPTNEHPGQMMGRDWQKDPSKVPLVVGVVDPQLVLDYSDRHDEMMMRATVKVTDAATQAAIKAGILKGFSCGYKTNLDATPGTYKGARYDAVQILPIEFDHVALVRNPRAPLALLDRTDSADNLSAWTNLDSEDYFMAQSSSDRRNDADEKYQFELGTGEVIMVPRELYKRLNKMGLGRDWESVGGCGCGG